MIQYALNQTRRILSSSRSGLQLVAKIRNQCELTIGRAHGWGIGCDPHTNGEFKWLTSVVERLQYVIDVGANKGEWTEFVISLKKPSAALLFDPSSSAAEILRRRFSKYPGIEIVEAAVGNLPGSMSFFEEENAGETSSLVRGASEKGSSREVSLTTLDAEVERRGWPSVDFLKIDAEGYDFHVLEGARRLFENGKVAYGQFEYNSPWRLSGSTLTYAISWLRDLGYECFLLKNDGLHAPNVELFREYYLYSNYAIIRKDLVEGALRSCAANF